MMRLKSLLIPVLLLLLSASAYAIQVSAPDVTVEPGATATIGIAVDAAKGIAGGDITLEYDAAFATVKEVRVTDLAKPIGPLSNATIAGKVKFAMASLSPLGAGAGDLFQIDFVVKATTGKMDLKLTGVGLFDENGNDLPAVTVKNGSITVKEKIVVARNLTIADAKVTQDANIIASVLIDDLIGVAGGDVILKYDPKILSVVEAKATDLLAGVSVIFNTATAGKITIAMASPKGLASSKGAIISVTFKGIAVGVSDFAFESAAAFDEAGKDIPVKTANGKITVEKKPCANPVIREHAADSKMLALQTSFDQADLAGFAYVDLWKGEFTVATGQFLEYQVAMFSGNPFFGAAVDFVTSDAKTLRDSGAKDQNGLIAHPGTDLAKNARDLWYHRKISLDLLAGKKLTGGVLATDAGGKHGAGLFRAYFDNIQITQDDCVVLSIYKDEDLVPISAKATSTGTTIVAAPKATKDSSISVVGVTAVTPSGKLASTWGNIKNAKE
jgi:hypothetical protein